MGSIRMLFKKCSNTILKKTTPSYTHLGQVGFRPIESMSIDSRSKSQDGLLTNV